jgi:hypothetical protein
MVNVDPLTRYVHVSYRVPADAPAEVTVVCSWSPRDKGEWQAAKVTPLVSETALRLVPEEEGLQWAKGRVTERRAAGLDRTVVFNPYPEAEIDGRVDVDFRIQVQTLDGRDLGTNESRVEADNSDVVYITDWSRVLQPGAVARGKDAGPRQWTWRTGKDPVLYCRYRQDVPVRQITYPLDLRGRYAVFVCTPVGYGIRVRLTGDERTDMLSARRQDEEVLWRWVALDRQHLVLKQPHSYQGYVEGRVRYIKLVPLTEEMAKRLEAQFGTRDKLIAGYLEPYSWAFAEDVEETLQHREPLAAFAEAGISLVDIQIGRFGDKVVYESRLTDQLLHDTIGDPLPGDPNPHTDNVGRMQQFTNALDAELRYARELGMAAHANFGATNCYPGTPLQGDFSKQHPEWMRGSALRYEVPQVRDYILNLYREALEIGAPGLSIDFCRYPEGIDKPETANLFMRKLRAQADKYGRRRGKRTPILVRFPVRGVRLWQNFDYRTWAHEGLVDYLCPSNIQGRHMHFDIRPYVEAVRGTDCKLLPCVDGLEWGLEMPGPFLWRVRQLYEAGVPGLYIYQADARILDVPADRRTMRMLGSSQAVRKWWESEEAARPHRSKGIYLQPAHEGPAYHPWQRLRLWVEGVPMGPMELLLDGELVTECDGPPYLLGTEEYESDPVIPPGDHALTVRVRDGKGWLEQSFGVQGAP